MKIHENQVILRKDKLSICTLSIKTQRSNLISILYTLSLLEEGTESKGGHLAKLK